MSDDPITRILSSIERLRVDLTARIDRLQSVSDGGPAGPPTEIVAHVQDVGDIEGNLGDWIGERRSGRWIEGFSIAPQLDFDPEECLYRVVLGRDQLSPWTQSGKYCGSVGLALPLRGFCLTLLGAAAAKYECGYTATFVDGSVLGLLQGGQVCASNALAPLEAFQILLRERGR
jgi:hypothetical protein